MEQNNEKKPRGFKVAPKNSRQIRAIAKFAVAYILSITGWTGLKDIDAEDFLERCLPQLGLQLEVIADNSDEISRSAPAALVGRDLKIRDSCYRGMCGHRNRDNFTLFHELGHYFLGHVRQYTRAELEEHEFFCDSEWQANQFAGEALMPVEVVIAKQLKTLEDFKKEFPYVSNEAIRVRMEKLRRFGFI